MRRWACASLAFSLVTLFCTPLSAQVVTKTGEIYGRVHDEQKLALPGVSVTLESTEVNPQSATTGEGGSFRFANLSPGIYATTFALSGFAEVRQEEIRVHTGGRVDLEITMKPSMKEEIIVKGETSILNNRKTGNSFVYTQEYLENVPNGRDPWFLLAMTAGVDSSRLDSGSGSVIQPAFFGRGDNFGNNVWNYDGINHTDPASPGSPPAYYDFEAFEEIQITTGGNDISIQTGGVAINLVTRRGGNRWEGQASVFRGRETRDYGFHMGGPILKDKLFAWGGYRFVSDQTQLELIHRESSTLADINAKLSSHWNSAHSSQLGYFRGSKEIQDRDWAVGSAPESLVDQRTGPQEGIWTAEHTWVPNDRFLLSGRYGFIGSDNSHIANGGTDKPVIYNFAVGRYEETNFTFDILRKSHDINLDGNYFQEALLGGDHEFRFGFEYKTSIVNVFSTYGNGMIIGDYYQTGPNSPLTSGYLKLQHQLNGHITRENASAYFSDTFRKDRFTLNLGIRYDFQTGWNNPTVVPAVGSFESFVGPISYPGGDPKIATKDFSPRAGITYAVTKDNKTLLRANYARYYDASNPSFIWHSNPTMVYNGAIFNYENANGDRTITPDELTSPPGYFGGLNGGPFDPDQFASKRIYDSNLTNAWTNELILGVDREFTKDFSIGVTFTHRRYGNFVRVLPFGIGTEDYVPRGNFTASTPLGDFSVPYFVLSDVHDGTAILTNIKDYEQSYRGLDIVLQKRMNNNFLLNGALTLQRQTGHYNGGDSLAIQTENRLAQGATFPFDPTNLPFLQDQPYSYAGAGGSLNPFSEWSLKFSGVYLFPWDISTGTFVRYQQGYPMVLLARLVDDSLTAFHSVFGHIILVEAIGSRRYGNIFTVDFQVQKSFDVGRAGKISGILTVFNLTNEQTVVSRGRFIESPDFNKVTDQLDARSYRFGLRYSF